MGTTARIYLVDDVENPKVRTLGERITYAKHRPPVVTLFQYMDGYPRTPSKGGVLDRLEAAFEHAPPHVLCAAERLAVYLLLGQNGDEREGHYNLVPRTPTVGAITYYDYLVICHRRVDEPPSIFVQLGCLWRTEADFVDAQAADEKAHALLEALEPCDHPSERVLCGPLHEHGELLPVDHRPQNIREQDEDRPQWCSQCGAIRWYRDQPWSLAATHPDPEAR